VLKPERRFVYILQSLNDPQRLHVGLTDDVKSRLAAHNGGERPHTAKHGPWRLHAAFWFASEQLAARFGRFLKSGSGRLFAKHHLE
jgi:predicted GIY-YIG superfamily endonuclease